MFSSHHVADEALPCRKSTGTPSSGPVNSTRVVIRSVVIIVGVTPGNVGTLISIPPSAETHRIPITDYRNPRPHGIRSAAPSIVVTHAGADQRHQVARLDLALLDGVIQAHGMQAEPM